MESATATRTDSARHAPQESQPPKKVRGRDDTGLSGWLRTISRRRIVLVDRGTQLRSAAIVGLFTLALLVPINLGVLVIQTTNTAQIAADSPELLPEIEAQNRLVYRKFLIGSVVILLAAMGATIYSTHRTAGAAVGLVRGLDRLRAGRYGGETVLRRGDRLRNLELALNQLSRTLLERSRQMEEQLECEAKVLDGISDSVEIQAVAERLRRIADRQRTHSA